MSRLVYLPMLLLCPALAAQQSFTVDPAAYTNQQGNATNPIPFNSASARYQQIHGGMRGLPRVIQGMSVRRGATANTTASPRTVDLTVLLADSQITQASTTFAANYASTPTTVFPLAQVNFPDWTVTGGSPEPWSLVIPFSTPHVYVGLTDLLWEWQLDNNSGSGQSYAADVYSGISLDLMNATSASLGAGCTVFGTMNPMSVGVRCNTSNVLNALYYRGTALNAPLSAPSAILLGGTNPAVPVPGLCTTLHTDGLISFPSVSTVNGTFSTPDVLVPYNPSWTGARLYTQAVSSDPSQLGLPLALSQGLETTLPGMQPAGAAPVVRIFDSTSSASTVGPIANYYSYGIIVRFTH